MTEGDEAGSDVIARLRHPRAIRWLHWINFPLLFVMMWSGLGIYLIRDLGRGLAFHFSFGWLFVINGAIYLVYLAATGEWRHIVPDRDAVREAGGVLLRQLGIRKEAPPQGKYDAAQRISYTAVLVMGLIIVVSGFAIYKPTQLHPLPLLFGGYQGARTVHFAVTIGLFLFFLIHLLQVLRAGWATFRSMVTGYLIETQRSDSETERTSTGEDAARGIEAGEIEEVSS